jgi:hypothetical protein
LSLWRVSRLRRGSPAPARQPRMLNSTVPASGHSGRERSGGPVAVSGNSNPLARSPNPCPLLVSRVPEIRKRARANLDRQRPQRTGPPYPNARPARVAEIRDPPRLSTA